MSNHNGNGRPRVNVGTCRCSGCDQQPHARGLCSTHYSLSWRAGESKRQQRPRPRHDICMVLGCAKTTHRGGGVYCTKHYSRIRRNGSPFIKSARVYLTQQPCVVEGCGKKVVGRGLCAVHWQHWKRRGDPLARSLRGEAWTQQENERALSILDRARDGLGRAQHGEVSDLSDLLGRTKTAVHSHLYDLRQKRLAGLPVP